MGTYDVALVCQNGHVINSAAQSMPKHNKKFCAECGSPTTSQCSHCSTPIQGEYFADGAVFYRRVIPAPGFCHECGKPFPWTEARIQAARELVDLSDASESEKEGLKASIPALTSNTPQTPVAAAKWKRFLQGAGKQVAETSRQILVDVVSETVKKTIWGP